MKIESTPKTKKKENHGGPEDTEVHRVMLNSDINLAKLRAFVAKKGFTEGTQNLKMASDINALASVTAAMAVGGSAMASVTAAMAGVGSAMASVTAAMAGGGAAMASVGASITTD